METAKEIETALLFYVEETSKKNVTDNLTAEVLFEELISLAETAGVEVVETVHQKLPQINKKHVLGKGKIEEIREIIIERKISCVISENLLSPAQSNNLAELLQIKVVDRAALILDIFAQRAVSGEGKLQVELAQLNYLLPKLTGQGAYMSRLGAGIGTRGPGETKLESDRRHLRRRISVLKNEIKDLHAHKRIQKARREKNEIPVVALVGYTNSGKSSLLNLIAKENILAEDKLFATLDTTTRMISLDNKHSFLLSDTVGFIRKLPHQLVEAFKATLEEVCDADLLLHVVDISSNNYLSEMETTEKVLEELSALGKPIIEVYNKSDLLPQEVMIAPGKNTRAIISAKTSAGLDLLLEKIKAILFSEEKLYHFLLPYEESDKLSLFYRQLEIIKTEHEKEGYLLSGIMKNAETNPSFAKYIIKEK